MVLSGRGTKAAVKGFLPNLRRVLRDVFGTAPTLKWTCKDLCEDLERNARTHFGESSGVIVDQRS